MLGISEKKFSKRIKFYRYITSNNIYYTNNITCLFFIEHLKRCGNMSSIFIPQ